MKTLISLIFIFLVMAAGCKKAEDLIYSDIMRVQLNDTSTQSTTFFYEAPGVKRDTVYVMVNTIGGITNYDRPVVLVQVPEYDYSYVRDPVTNQITDTIKTEKPNKALPGVHYLSLDDASLKSRMVIRANHVSDSLPIVLLRDASLQSDSYRLRVELQGNTEFSLGEIKARGKTIIFSDRLERFYSWRVDSYAAPAFGTFGKYSTGKHQFMIDVLKVNIDESWYQAVLTTGASSSYANLLKQELIKFNNDPQNITNGKAPIRETSSPTSAAIFFP